MLLLLARHGNTFAPNEEVVWVGARNDPDLVASGIEQARTLSRALNAHELNPTRIYCGPLRRTRSFAQLVLEGLTRHAVVQVDERLNEIDYGSWSGLTDQAIIDRFGREQFEAWIERAIPPQDSDWQPGQAQLRSEASELLTELRGLDSDLVVLLVSSNGRLRYYYEALGGEAAEGRMRTGHVGVARLVNNKFKLLAWNIEPNALKVPADL